MRSLPGAPDSPQWDHSLVSDMAYIKARMRYRMTGKIILPVIVWSIILILAITIAIVSYRMKVAAGEKPNSLVVLASLSAASIFLAIIFQHLASLTFIKIDTGMPLAENSLLTNRFLEAQHLVVFRHPEIPEVYQIISRNISAGKEDREILIFIADDNRILINSHFTNMGWSLFPSGRHHTQMARMLKDYINNQRNSTGLMHQTF
jgi:hypothetical protein